jgi:hypothetical protein
VGDEVVDEEEELGRGPLQKPWLQVLNAHWESEVQPAWKLPQTGIRKELTA